jgi:hypothetical protein
LSANLALEFTKVLAWPLITLIVLTVFWKPIRDVARLLPSMLESTETLQVGSVSLRLRAQITRIATEEVRSILKQLDANTLRYILAEDGGGVVTLYGEHNDEVQQLQTLIRLGLARIPTAEDMGGRSVDEEENADHVARFTTTALYDDTRAFLLDLIPELISQYQRNDSRRGAKKRLTAAGS